MKILYNFIIFGVCIGIGGVLIWCKDGNNDGSDFGCKSLFLR